MQASLTLSKKRRVGLLSFVLALLLMSEDVWWLRARSRFKLILKTQNKRFVSVLHSLYRLHKTVNAVLSIMEVNSRDFLSHV